VADETTSEPVSLEEDQRVTVSMWTADAVVLYNWLMCVDIEAFPHEHRAELQALGGLLTSLAEHVERASASLIDEARDLVEKDMPF
jgi:hypothetical protein